MPKWIAYLVVQANLLYKLSPGKFASDLGRAWRHRPGLVCLNEVARRKSVLVSWASKMNYYFYMPATSAGVALFADKDRYFLLDADHYQLHKNPPGAPTAREIIWLVLFDKYTWRVKIYFGHHSIAAVERGNKFNKIRRTPYYIKGIMAIIPLIIRVRRQCKKDYGVSGQVILSGDFNWAFTAKSWIVGVFRPYFKINHIVLGYIKTHGSRGIDAIMTRGSGLLMKKQGKIEQNSDHDTLWVMIHETLIHVIHPKLKKVLDRHNVDYRRAA